MQVIAVLFLLLVGVVASPVRETNGERLARGLPPLPPTFRRLHPGREEAYTPTPASAAVRAAPSSTPATYAGRILVRSLDNLSLGFVSSSNVASLNGLGSEYDLQVKITTTGGLTDIAATNIEDAAVPVFLGATIAAPGTFIPGSEDSNELSLTLVPQSSVYARALKRLESTSVYETTIWKLDPATNLLSVQWANPDASSTLVEAVPAYVVEKNITSLVGDIQNFVSQNSGYTAQAVNFVFVPN
ncbi:hypothetical protein JAAARDRAFT_55047 [Jaapia argillacea MUCL 33604]|uniref:Uncharacterized protein n=1 Tax=Jaapia argillacea MUCL 33604 TaxID=933084 RepID=A0A067QGH7_9AGAM|nr:hypothetical protein JAAARDRAFT_55047 [Jaapia argillacea MUCL 33604]